MRYATVRARSQREVEAYLPDNYKVVGSHLAAPSNDGPWNFVIQGEDFAGWTLDGYVLPRLASGNLFGREHATLADAHEAAAASMN